MFVWGPSSVSGESTSVIPRGTSSIPVAPMSVATSGDPLLQRACRSRDFLGILPPPFVEGGPSERGRCEERVVRAHVRAIVRVHLFRVGPVRAQVVPRSPSVGPKTA